MLVKTISSSEGLLKRLARVPAMPGVQFAGV